jgi:hypothetical protein
MSLTSYRFKARYAHRLLRLAQRQNALAKDGAAPRSTRLAMRNP